MAGPSHHDLLFQDDQTRQGDLGKLFFRPGLNTGTRIAATVRHDAALFPFPTLDLPSLTMTRSISMSRRRVGSRWPARLLLSLKPPPGLLHLLATARHAIVQVRSRSCSVHFISFRHPDRQTDIQTLFPSTVLPRLTSIIHASSKD